ncbi:hypothetical protein [Hydrogenophaga sp.]|uniref:hypothetical protein n=1 Tax=Hydrogenophaga sp. TaxID=1904254 RepID=UPI00260E0E17|nr:hypothetical protein [Hydrogenophaga sp.]
MTPEGAMVSAVFAARSQKKLRNPVRVMLPEPVHACAGIGFPASKTKALAAAADTAGREARLPMVVLRLPRCFPV